MRDILGKRLREAQERVGFSQRGLEVHIGLPPKKASVYINRWERQGVQPTWENIEKMARTLETPSAFFLAEDDVLAEIILLANGMPTAEKKYWWAHFRNKNNPPIGDQSLFHAADIFQGQKSAKSSL